MRNRPVVLLVTLVLALVCAGRFSSATEAKKARADEPGATAKPTGRLDANLTGPGLKEVVDLRYQKRYSEWKHEFLSTDIGRAQWELHAKHPRLIVTITIVSDNKHGAGTGNYKWNDKGELIGATIYLGSRPLGTHPSATIGPWLAVSTFGTTAATWTPTATCTRSSRGARAG